MIIVMEALASKSEIRSVLSKIKELGYTPHTIHGKTRKVIGAIDWMAPSAQQVIQADTMEMRHGCQPAIFPAESKSSIPFRCGTSSGLG